MSSSFVRIVMTGADCAPVNVKCEDIYQAKRYAADLNERYPMNVDHVYVSNIQNFEAGTFVLLFDYAPEFINRDYAAIDKLYKWCAHNQTTYYTVKGGSLDVRKIQMIKDLREAHPGFSLVQYRDIVDGYIKDAREVFESWSEKETLRFAKLIKSSYDNFPECSE